ncbi:hypothetical protein GCM10020331_065370 [Ectobacillus funiculus]
MWMYTKLSDYYPDETLVQMLSKIIGKFLSYPLIVIYALYFLYLACTACRDFGELIASTILTETPMIMVIGSFMVLIIYCPCGGIEALGRMGGNSISYLWTYTSYVMDSTVNRCRI